MVMSLGEAQYTIGADWSQMRAGLDQAEGHFQNWASGVSGSVQRVGEVMLGVLVAQAIPKVINGLKNMASEALNAVASYERMSMSLETLTAKEIRQNSAVTEVVKLGQTRIQLTEAEKEKLTDLTRQRELLNAKMQEETERHRQLVLRWGEEGLAVKTHTVEMSIMKDKIDDTSTEISKLEKKQGALVNVTKTNTHYTLTMAQALEQAKGKAAELLRWVEMLAVKSPFDSEGIAAALRTAQGYGFTTEQAKRLTQALVDFSAGSGGTTEQLNRITLALGQMRSKTKASGEELRQLSEAGLPVTEILANAFNVTTAEMGKMVEKGAIPAQKAIEAIVTYLEENFEGAGERQAISWAGLLSTFKEIKTIGLREVFTGLFTALQPVVAKVSDLFFVLRDNKVLENFGKVLGSITANLLGPFSVGLDRVGAFITQTQKVNGSMMGIGAITAGAKPDMLTGMLQAAFGPQALKPLQILRETVQMLGDALNVVKGAVTAVWNAVKPLIDNVTQRIPGFIKLKDVVAGLGIILATAVVPHLIAAVGALLNFAAPIVAVIAAVALLRTAWETNFGGIQEKTQAVIATVTQGWQQLVSAFQTGGLPAVGAQLGVWWQGVVTYVTTNAPLWAEQLKAQIGVLWQGFTTWWDTNGPQIVQQIGVKLGQLWAGLVAYVQTMAGVWWSAVSTTYTWIWNQLVSWWDASGQTLVAQLGTKLGVWWQGVVTWFTTNAPVWGAQVKALMAQVWANLTTFDTGASTGLTGFGQIVNQIQAFAAQLQPILSQIGAIFGPIITRIIDGFRGMGAEFEVLKPKLAALWETLQPVFTGLAVVIGVVLKVVGELTAQIIDRFIPVLGGIIDVITAVVEAVTTGQGTFETLGVFINGLRVILDNLVGALWDTFVNTINDVLGTSVPTWEELKRTVAGGVESALKSVTDKLAAWKKAGSDMIAGLFSGITQEMGKVGAFFKGVGEDIVNAFKEFFGIASPSTVFAGLGGQIIEGLFEGIKNSIGSLVTRLKDIIGQLPDAVKKLLGIASPSKVFAEIGAQAMAGLGAGFTAGVGDTAQTLLDSLQSVLKVLKDWASTAGVNKDDLTRTQELTDPLNAIIGGITQIAQNLQALALVRIPANVTAKMTTVIDALRPVLNMVRTFAGAQPEFSNDRMTNMATTIFEPLTQIVSGLQTIALSLANIGQLRLNTAALTAGLPGMITAVSAIITSMSALGATLKAADVANALGVAQIITALVAPFETAATGLRSIFDLWASLTTEWRTVDMSAGQASRGTGVVVGGVWARALAWLRWNLQGMRDMLADLFAKGDISEELSRFAAQLTELVSPIQTAATAITSIVTLWESLSADWQKVDFTNGQATRGGGVIVGGMWAVALNWLRNILQQMRDALSELFKKGEIAAELTQFAGQLTALINPFQTVATAMTAIMKFWTDLDTRYKVPSGRLDTTAGWTGAIQTLAAMLQEMRAQLAQLLKDHGAIPAELTQFAADLGSIAEPLQKAVNLLKDLGTWEDSGPLVTKVDRFVAEMTYILTQLEQLRKDTQQWLTDNMLNFTKALGDIADGLRRGVGLLVDLDAWEASASVLDKVDLFIADWNGIFKKLAEAVTDWDQDNAKTASAWGTAVGALATGLLAGVELLTQLDGYATVAGTTIEAFMTDIGIVVGRFLYWVVGWGDTTVAELVKAWGDALGAMIDGLSKGLDLLNNLRSYSDIAGTVIEAFMTDIGTLTGRFLYWVVGWGDKDVADLVKSWGEAVNAMMSGLSAGLTLLNNLRGYTDVLDTTIETFMTDIGTLTGRFLYWVVGWGDKDVADLVKSWGEAVNAMMSGLSAGLTLLNNLRGYTDVLDTTIETFMIDVGYLLNRFMYWVVGWGAKDVADLVKAWGEAVGAMANGLGAALTLLNNLRGYVDVLDTEIEAFIKDVSYLTKQFINNIVAFGNEDVAALVKAWGDALTGMVSGLGAALTLLNSLRGYVDVLDTDITGFIEDVRVLTQAFIDHIVKLGTTEFATTVKTWGEAVGALANGLGAALTVLVNLRTYIGPADALMQNFVTDVKTLVLKFAAQIPDLAKTIIPATLKDWGDTLGSLFNGLTGALTVLGGLVWYISPSETHLTNFINDIKALLTKFQTVLLPTLTPIQQAATKSFADAMSALFGSLQSGISLVKDLRDLTGVDSANAQGTFYHHLQQFTEALLTVLTQWDTFIQNNFPVGDMSKLAAIQAVTGVIGGITTNLSSAVGMVQNIADFVTGNKGFAAYLTTFNTALQGALSDWLKWITGELTPQTADVTGKFASTLTDLAEALKAALQLIVQLNASGVPPATNITNFVNSVITLIGTLATGIAAQVPLMVNGIQDYAGKMTTALDTYLGKNSDAYKAGYNKGNGIGFNILAGLAAAIDPATATATTMLKNAANALVLWLKAQMESAAGIASPSKLFAQVGTQIPAGLAVGISNGTDSVDRAMSEMYRSLGLGTANMGVSVTGERDLHIYLHGDGLSDLSADQRREVVSDLARMLKLQGLRPGMV